jgi:excisionase family DNA binding protein
MHKKRKASGAMMKPDQAWDLIGRDQISRRSLYNAIERGEVPAVRLGRRILIPRHSFMLWLQGKKA